MEHPDRGVGRVWDLDTRGQEVGGVHEIIEFSWTSFIYDPYVIVYLCIYLCHASWQNKKRYRPKIWYTRSSRPHLNKGFLFFRKSNPEGRQPRKTAVSRRFSAYFLDCLINYFILWLVNPISFDPFNFIKFTKLKFIITKNITVN